MGKYMWKWGRGCYLQCNPGQVAIWRSGAWDLQSNPGQVAIWRSSG